MRKHVLLLAATLLAACGAPVIQHVAGLRVSAHDALREANLQAVSWDPDAALSYVEGVGISPDGYAPAGAESLWRFAFDAPSKTEQLVVSVSAAAEERVTRPRQSPSGIALGNARLRSDWIDSPRALEAIRASLPADTTLSMLLVPTTPPQWIVRAGGRQWRVHASTGAPIP